MTRRTEADFQREIHRFFGDNSILLDKAAIDADICSCVPTTLGIFFFVAENIPQGVLELICKRIGNGARGM